MIGTLVVRGNDGKPAYAIHHDLSLGDIKPSALHDCLVAAEDKRFYRHTGMDYFGLARALLDRLVTGNRLRGAASLGPGFRSRYHLFIEPDRRQVLVEIMTWADFPALHICVMWHHSVPPQQKDVVRFGVENVFLEVAH